MIRGPHDDDRAKSWDCGDDFRDDEYAKIDAWENAGEPDREDM